MPRRNILFIIFICSITQKIGAPHRGHYYQQIAALKNKDVDPYATCAHACSVSLCCGLGIGLICLGSPACGACALGYGTALCCCAVESRCNAPQKGQAKISPLSQPFLQGQIEVQDAPAQQIMHQDHVVDIPVIDRRSRKFSHPHQTS